MLVAASIVLDVAMLAFAGALICCLLKRWQVAVKVSTFVTIAGPAVLLALVGRFVAAVFGPTDPTLKATLLAQAISELMNRAVLPLVVTLAALSLRAFARRRARRVTPAEP
jgi:hypothetical protein